MIAEPKPDPEAQALNRMERRLAREKRARLEAEELLENKSRALYEANLDLGHMACALEAQVRALEAERTQVAGMSRTDPLTGLLNRAAFAEAVHAELTRVENDDRPLALFAIDLDKFKAVNDSRGHAAGDAALQAIAARLAEIARDSALAARMGGDEFQLAFWLDAHDFDDLARRIQEALSTPIDVAGGAIVVGGSIGAARRPQDAQCAARLQTFADLALHVSKQTGRGRLTEFDPHLYDDELRRRELREALRRGVERGEIEAWFQPIIPNAGPLAGPPALEILARWRHPQHGVIMPAEFVPLAEEGGFVSRMTEMVLRAASEPLIEWAAAGRLSHVACNISMLEFQERRFAARFVEMARDLKLPLDRIAIEITETCLCEEPSLAKEHLQRLTEAGLRAAIDDFGTGYSNLRALMDLPVHTLKLDRSLITDLGVDPRSNEMLHGVLRIARGLGLAIVAEGVERQRQVDFLRAAGCDMLQGYFFSKPLSRGRMEPWLARESGAYPG